MINNEIKTKLIAAKDTEEVKAILIEAGRDVTSEEAERILQEIEHHTAGGKRRLDQDEMDAVAGGRNWIDEGCTATCEEGSWCWSNDRCYLADVVYEEFHDACIDGGHHNYVFDHIDQNLRNVYICTKCGKYK